MNDIPTLTPDKIIEKISNKKTGEIYKNDNEWKSKGILPEDIRRDVTVMMPSLDLFGKTKQNRQMAITRAQQYRQMLREGSVAMQGGVKNYLGKQKTVSDVPVKWQSGKDKPSTELAYITDAEKKLLLKEDIHGSLKDGPNTGPEGIISLDSQGDMGGSEDKGTNADGSNNPGYDF